ncbi:hypothetical protein ZWY2020_044841 [Hordeum vulgare]|nr:hypothetical protein ZWY2020_044841 [Hordeum vulgare]
MSSRPTWSKRGRMPALLGMNEKERSCGPIRHLSSLPCFPTRTLLPSFPALRSREKTRDPSSLERCVRHATPCAVGGGAGRGGCARGRVGGCAVENLSQNRVYAACSDLPTLGASVHWTYDPETSSLFVAFFAAPLSSYGWVAWGLNPTGDGMAGTQALIAAPKGGAGASGVETTYKGLAGSPHRHLRRRLAVLGSDDRVEMFGSSRPQRNRGGEPGPVDGPR